MRSKAVALYVAGLLGLGLAILPARAAAPVSPVRFMLAGTSVCSAVILGPRHGLTAAHCLKDKLSIAGRTVRGLDVGDDLAELEPGARDFDPPYAKIGTQTDLMSIEGYGCNPFFQTLGPTLFHRSKRSASMLGYAYNASGTEIVIAGLICPGDSGGALWNDRGELTGIVTAIGTAPKLPVPYGYATPAR